MLRWRRRDPDRELAEEFETHLSLETERQIANGLSPRDAADIARRKFGNALAYREQVADLREMIWLERLLLDLRAAIRALAHRPVASVGAIAALGFGMAAPTVVLLLIATVATAVFPQIEDPDGVVMLWETEPTRPGEPQRVSAASWDVFRNHPEFFDGISAAERPLTLSVTLGEYPETVAVEPIAPDLLQLIGVAPARGRAFVASDAALSAPPVALVSHAFWQTRLGASDSVVGATLSLDGDPYTIVGVMPRGFWVAAHDIDLWVPMPRTPGPGASYHVIARLRPGDTRESLRLRLASLSPQLAAANQDRTAEWGVVVRGLGPRTLLNEVIYQPGVLMLLAAIAIALIVACANVAMIMVARGVARQKETAVRAALGASRLRVIRQLLAESTLLSTASGVLALAFAYAVMIVVVANGPLQGSSELPPPRLDWRVVAAVLSLSTTVGILAGIAPALNDSRVDLVAALKETGYFSATPSRQRVRRTLIVGEVALTVMLLANVSLLVRGILDVEQVSPGIDTRNTLRVRLDGMQHVGRPRSHVPDASTLLDRLRDVPGVHSAAAVSTLAPAIGQVKSLVLTGDADRAVREPVNAVTPDFFRTLGLKLVDGTTFTEASPHAAVVSRAFATRHWGDQSTIGQTLRLEGETDERQVIGVVSDQLQFGPRRDPAPVVFVPFTASATSNNLALVVGISLPARDVVPAVRKAVASVDPLQTVQVSTVQDVLDIGALESRIGAYVSGPLMLLALLLTVMGIYGLLAQSVSQRTHELAVRLTLGASGRDLLTLVARDGFVLAGVGAVIGAAGGWALDRLLTVFLFAPPSEEILALAGAAGTMMLVTLLASLVPVRRALSIDPGRTLKYE
jgi:predicted permease